MYRSRIVLGFFCCLLMLSSVAWAKTNRSKSGVAPQVLTLPKGGGAVRGLGETFVPDLNSGTGTYEVPLQLPAGRNEFTPSLTLEYSSGRGNDPFGLGWDMPIIQITRRTEKGVPQYNNDEDIFAYNGMELVPIAPGKYRPRYEGFFGKVYHQQGTGDFWEVWAKNGEQLFLGDQPDSRIESNGQVFAWRVTKQTDANGNVITYHYTDDGAVNRYLSRIEYAIYAVEFHYEPRPDSYTHYRSGFGIETTLRCKEILVRLNIPGENRFERIRRYELGYTQSPDSGVSLLTQITQYGTDDSAYLPPLKLTYSAFDPAGSYRRMQPNRGSPPTSLADPNYELADVNADSLADVLYTGETTHLYWLNLGDDTWAPAQAIRRSPQGVQLSDDGILLADMDGNGKSDLLFSRGSSFGYWRGYGNREWEEFVHFDTLPSFSFKDPSVRLMDVNGDGLTDVLKTTARYFTYWLNLDGRQWQSPVSRRFTSIFREGDGPGTVFSNNPESDARLGDMNGDGLQDIVSVHNGNIRYWPHRGYLRFAPMVRMTGTPRLPLRQFQRNRFLVGDINNDGFADLVYVDRTRAYYWFNLHGKSWSQRYKLASVPYARGDADVRLADMNGNGTRDLVWSQPVRGTDRTNYRYFDFVGDGNYPRLLTEIDNNMGLVTQIAYKPIIQDYLKARRRGEPWKYKLPIAVKTVASLRLIDNISDSSVETRYSYADGYYDGRDREFRGFGYAEERTMGDTSSPDSLVKDFFYVGYSERVSQKDAEKARALKGQLSRREVYGLDGTKLENKPYEVLTRRWETTVLNEISRVDARGYQRKAYVVFPYLVGTLTSAYERTDTPRHTAIAYEYDVQYGSLTKTTEYGEVTDWDMTTPVPTDVPVEDMRVTTTQYAVRDNTLGYVVRPSEIIVRDKDGTVLSQTQNHYDGASYVGLPLGQVEKGNLHRVRVRAFTPAILTKAYGGVDTSSFSDIPLDEWVDNARYEYDTHGLLKSFKDARGVTTVKVDYDSYGLFPVRVTNPLNHVVKVEYDYIGGAIKRHVDANQTVMENTFDPLGMVERVVQPGDTPAYPTLWYQYDLHIYQKQRAQGISKPSPPYVTTWMRERPPVTGHNVTTGQQTTPSSPVSVPDVYISRTFFDGLGRVIQTRSEETGGNVLVSGWVEYNAKGRPKSHYLPFFATGFDYVDGQKPDASTGETKVRSELHYDPLGHLTKTMHPDKNYSKMRYAPQQSSSYDEEDVIPTGAYFDTPKQTTFDAYGRLIQVTEYASQAKKPITTQYSYDLNGHLTQIADATGKTAHKRHYTYDLLGRRLSAYEPNTGTHTYFYDLNGNLIYQRDNKGQWIRHEYDALNRPTKRYRIRPSGPQIVLTNTYDSGGGQNLVGRLARTEDMSGSLEYSYDARGRIQRKTRRLKDLNRDCVMEYRYDSMDRVTAITYPDAKRTVVTYEYDEGNHLKRIPGYVDEIRYNAKEQRTSVRYANGVQTKYAYEPLTFRLHSLKTTSAGGADGDLQHVVYTYDRVGNIVGIEDKGPPSSKQRYTYDALYRLTRAVNTGVTGYDVTYAYDEIGNLIQKSDLASGTFEYHTDGRPHTLDSYGNVSLGYDANGNLLKTPGMTLYWDEEDRLVKMERSDGTVATYGYDAAGLRVKKHVAHGNESRVDYYVDRLFEIRDGQERLYIFDDQMRVAWRKPQAQTVYYHGDHLGSVVIRTDDNGKAIAKQVEYGPFGRLLNPPSSSQPGHGYNAKEWDTETGFQYYGRRYYVPETASWISADHRYIDKTPEELDAPLQWNLYSYCAANPLTYIDPTGARRHPAPLTSVYSLKYLKQYAPKQFRAAEKAYGKYLLARSYEKTYWALNYAASNSTLQQDIFSGDLVLKASKQDLSSLLKQVANGTISGKVTGHSMDLVLGKRLAGWFGVVKQLDDVRKQIRNRRLLGRNDAAARAEKFSIRLKLLARLKASDINKEFWQKTGKFHNPESLSMSLYIRYRNFEAIYREYSKYIHQNQKLYLDKKLGGKVPLSERKPKFEAAR